MDIIDQDEPYIVPRFEYPQQAWLRCNQKKICSKIRLQLILWIDIQNYYQLCHREMLQYFDIYACNNVERAIQKMEKCFVSTVIIDNFQIFKKMSQKGVFKQVRNIIFLMKDESEIQLFSKQNVQKIKFIQSKMKTNEQIQIISKHLFDNSERCIQFPNFIQLDNMYTFKRKRIGLYSIQDFKGDQQLAFKDFYNICVQCNIDQFSLKEFQLKKQTFKKPIGMLQYYTRQTFFFQLINKALKVIQHPMETVWFRFPYSKLKQAIKQLHKNEILLEFDAYRGGFISQKEYNLLKKDQIYQNMGFLSTSTDKMQAQSFINNCFVTIKVNDQYKMSNGFCQVSKYSISKHQKQVIFSTNNLFKLLNKQIKKIKKKNTYCIEFQLINQFPQQLKKSFKDLQMYKHTVQGIALQQFNVNNSIQYFRKRLAQIEKNVDKKNSMARAGIMAQLGIYLKIKGYHNYDQALNYFKQAYDIFLTHGYDNTDVKTQTIILYIAQIYQNTGKFENAQDMLSKIQNFQQTTFDIQRSINFQFIGQYDKALESMQRVLQIKLLQGKISESVAFIYDDIGKLWDLKKQYEIAIAYFKEAEDIFIKCLANEYINLANSYFELRDYKQSMYYYELALQTFQQRNQFGVHIKTPSIQILSQQCQNNWMLRNIIFILVYTNSKPYIQEIVARAFRCLGIILYNGKKYESALVIFLLGVFIQKNKYSRAPTYSEQMFEYMSRIYFFKGDLESTLSCNLQANPDHGHLFTAMMLINRSQTKEQILLALKYTLRSLQIYSSKKGSMHDFLVEHLKVLAKKLKQTSNLNELDLLINETCKLFYLQYGQQDERSINFLNQIFAQ